MSPSTEPDSLRSRFGLCALVDALQLLFLLAALFSLTDRSLHLLALVLAGSLLHTSARLFANPLAHLDRIAGYGALHAVIAGLALADLIFGVGGGPDWALLLLHAPLAGLALGVREDAQDRASVLRISEVESLGGWSKERLLASPQGVLRGLLDLGTGPAADALAGWDHEGHHLGVLAAIRGRQGFVRCFFDPLHGRGLEGGDRPYLHGGDAERLTGCFVVQDGGSAARDLHPSATVLDFTGSVRNPDGEERRHVHEILVLLPGHDASLLLGETFWTLGPLRLSLGHFVLERSRYHGWRGPGSALPAPS